MTAYTAPSFDPTYTVPSSAMVGEDWIPACVAKLHTTAPVAPLNAYRLVSMLPTNTMPVAPIAGDEKTFPPVV